MKNKLNVVVKIKGEVVKVTVDGFSDDPASDLGKLERVELESMFKCDKGSPILIRVK